MLTNAIKNMPSLVYNFKEIIKYCQEETKQYFCLQNHASTTRTEKIQYNQLHYYPQRQFSCNNSNLIQLYYYQNDPKKYLYKKKSLSRSNGLQNIYLSPQHNYSLQSSQQNSPYRIQNIQMSPYYDSRNVDQYSLYQQV